MTKCSECEKMREALEKIIRYCQSRKVGVDYLNVVNTAEGALPTKALSEDEIAARIVHIYDTNGTAMDIVRYLKQAGVLYCKDNSQQGEG